MLGFMLLSATLYVNLAITGNDASPILPIISGQRARVTRFPFQATILYKKRMHCSGSIISKRFIITTANCCRPKSKFLTVRVGTPFLNMRGTVKQVQKKFIHPGHKKMKTVHDVCLLRLAQPLTYSKTVKRAKLPRAGQKFRAGIKTASVGYGFYWPSTRKLTPNERLYYFTAPIARFRTCRASPGNKDNTDLYAKFPRRNTSIICTGRGYYGIEPCRRSRGVPLITMKKRVLIGVFSHGHGQCYGSKKSDLGEPETVSGEGDDSEEEKEVPQHFLEVDGNTDPEIPKPENQPKKGSQTIIKRIPATFASVVVNRRFIRRIAKV